MKSLKNIVIGTSLTEHSDSVVRTGLAIAKATGATPWLIHAGSVLLDPSGAGVDAIWSEKNWNNLRELLDEQARRTWLAALPGFSHDQVRLVIGAPHREIVELARSVQADLVIIGAAESSHMLGSTADRVIRKAPCPVLAVRSEAAFPPIRVEFPVDLSATSANALRQGLDFLAQLGLPATESEVLFVLHPFEVGGSINFTPEQIQHFAGEELSRFVTANASGRARPQSIRVRTGYAREEILAALKERRADLAVLGTHGRTGFERFMLGSVASGVLRDADCNLLIVPPTAEHQEHPAGADWTYVSDESPVLAGRS
ncbi:MAG TPA: universal stress protein [Thermoanaerobaculia bacterium]|nr:universal stress protein [Thermoanaerobaculia bacterium]